MSRIAKAVLAVVGVVVAITAVKVILFQPSDSQLIETALNESIRAGKEGRPGGVLEYLSRSLTVNSEAMVDRKSIADFVRRAKPDVILRNMRASVEGDRATVVTPVLVKFEGLGMSMEREIPDVTITLQKERGTKWLVLPVTQWRIVEVSGSLESLSGLVQGF